MKYLDLNVGSIEQSAVYDKGTVITNKMIVYAK